MNIPTQTDFLTLAPGSDLRAFLEPRSIAVVGASPGKSAYPNLILKNLRAHGFPHEVVVIHPKFTEVDGFRAVPSILALQEPPDLCVIAIRANLVASVLRECTTRQVPAVTIVASGFAEQNTLEGFELQRELSDIVTGSRTRVIGPNCLGVASFASRSVGMASGNIPSDVPLGPTAIVSQSGGVSLVMMLRGLAQGLRINHMISLGNELDVSVPESIDALSRRADVNVIMCYIEGIRDPGGMRRAIAGCNRLGKPVIILRGGTTPEGKLAAVSHTGALSGDGAIWRAFAAQTGAITVDSIDHAIATARLFLEFGRSKGSAIAAFGGGGGLTVLFTDLLAAAGICTPPFMPETQRRIKAALPDVSPHNPMEMGGLFLSGDGTMLEMALKALADEPRIDALALCVPPYLEMRDRTINGAIVRATEGLAKPVIIISYAPSSFSSVLRDAGRFILEPPEAGILGLRSWLNYKPINDESGGPELPDVRSGVAQRVFEQTLSRGETLLLEDAAKLLLTQYGILCPKEQTVDDEQGAILAAENIGFPVALKLLAPWMLHRGIGKGVLLGLADRDQVVRGFCALRQMGTGQPPARVLVQAMARPGMEFIVGAVRDPELGLALAIGLGGVNVEAKREILFCMPPVSPQVLRTMLDNWGAFAEAQRRHGTVDSEALLGNIVHIAALLDESGDYVQEMDINPIIVGRPGEGAIAVDALFSLRNPEVR